MSILRWWQKNGLPQKFKATWCFIQWTDDRTGLRRWKSIQRVATLFKNTNVYLYFYWVQGDKTVLVPEYKEKGRKNCTHDHNLDLGQYLYSSMLLPVLTQSLILDVL